MQKYTALFYIVAVTKYVQRNNFLAVSTSNLSKAHVT